VCGRAERKRHHRPMDPDAKRKDHETSQFHRARGQMMTYNNLAIFAPPAKEKTAFAKSKASGDVDDSKTKKLKVGTLRPVTVIKPKVAVAVVGASAVAGDGGQTAEQAKVGDGAANVDTAGGAGGAGGGAEGAGGGSSGDGQGWAVMNRLAAYGSDSD